MIHYTINNLKNQYYLCSPFNSRRFLYRTIKGENTLILPSSRYVVNVELLCAYFTNDEGHKWREASVNVEYRKCTNSTHPFTHLVGPAFEKYDAIFRIETNIIRIFLYVKLNENVKKRKTPILSLNEVKRNCSFAYDNHVWRVLKIEDEEFAKTTNDKFILKGFNKVKTNKQMPALICYDVETLWDKQGVLRPFVICAQTTVDDSKFLWYKTQVDLRDESDYDEGVKLFTDWIISKLEFVNKFYGCDLPSNYNHMHVRLFGYNNFNFDNHMFYDSLRLRLEKFSFIYNSRFGKTTNCNFKYRGLEFSCVDLIKFFPGRSLSSACASFKIKQAKYELNILKYVKACCDSQRIIEETRDINLFFKEGAEQDVEFFKPFLKQNGSYDLYEFVRVYCERDVEATMELYNLTTQNIHHVFDSFEKINVFVPHYDIFSYISPPQISFILLKGLLANKGEKLLVFQDNKYAAKVYDTYFGGHTDYTLLGHCFPTPDATGNCEYAYYDVTSEYPTTYDGYFACARNAESILIGDDFPLENLQKIIDVAKRERNELFANRTLHTTYAYLQEFCKYRIFAECNIAPPENKWEYGMWAPIGRKIYTGNSVRLEFQNVAQKNRNCNTPQICLLILMGWTVVLVENETNICFTETERILQEYVQIVGKEKTKAFNNKALRDIWKLFMNSLYGKLAMQYKNILGIQQTNCGEEMYVSVNEKMETFDFSQSYHYISADITGWATFLLNKKCYFAELSQIYDRKTLEERVNTVVYCDTDSLIFNKGKISPFLTFKISEEIGVWDSEMGMFDETYKEEVFGAPIKSIIILAKKAYFPLDAENNLLSIKVKGLHKNEAKHITFDDLKRAADGKDLKFNFPGIAKSSNYLEQQNLKYREDFVKTLRNVMLKKTVRRDNFYDGDVLEVKCAETIKANRDCLERKLYKDDVNNFLVFISSTLIENKWQKQKQEASARLDKFIDNIIANKDSEVDNDIDSDFSVSSDEDNE